MKGIAHEFCLAPGEPGNTARIDAVDRKPSAGFNVHLQNRATKPVKQQSTERFEALIMYKPEADQLLELGLGPESCTPRTAVEIVLEFRQRVLIELGLPQLQHGFDGGNDPVAARFRKQRGIVALGLIAVGPCQV